MSSKKNKPQSANILSYVVFFVALAVIIPSILSLIFPALIPTLLTPSHERLVDPFEIGWLAVPFFSVGFFLLAFGLLYYSGNLPGPIQRSIKFILIFEVNRRISFLVLAIFLAIYIGLSIGEITEPEQWVDFKANIKPILEDWPANVNSIDAVFSGYTLKFFLLYASEKIFQNVKIVPFIASISLLILAYFFTVEVTKKRFSGLVAIAILLQSFTFLKFGSSATYSNFWALFYLLSLYLIIKKWQFAALSYVASILSKPLTILFLPSTLFFIYRAEISMNQKIFTALSCGMIVVIGFVVIYVVDLNSMSFVIGDYSRFDRFINGFTALQFQLRFDQFILIFLVPLVCGLFMISRKGKKIADAILFLIVGTLISSPIATLAGFDIHPYRLIPFIVFFSIGIGTIFSQKLTKQV